MHELSIAQALVELVNQHAPPAVTVEAVMVEAGPMRAIDPDAMQLAWQSATVDTPLAATRLQLKSLPWRLECRSCGATFESEELFVPCACGNPTPRPVGGNDLRLISLDVNE